MKSPKIILLLFFVFSIMNTYSQELIEAKCYGGKEQLRSFLNAEMVYPEKDLQEGKEGTVVIYFVLDERGKVVERNIELSVSPLIDKEALRLFSKILWQPATLYNNPVSIKQSFPINFNIKKYKRIVKRRGYSDIPYPIENIDTSNLIYDLDKLDHIPDAIFEEKGMNLSKFIAENTIYPETAFKQDIKGTVKLLFVIEPSGNVSNCHVTESVGGGCNEEAKRIIRMIKWKPGIKNGMAVRSLLSFGITFGGAGNSSFEYFPTHHGSTMQ